MAMAAIELSRYSLREKFQIMETIWEELRERAETFEVPDSHKALLAERRRRVEDGEATLLDWDEVKHTLGRR